MDFTSRYCRRRLQTSAACPSASLAVNCCQFSCCVPDIPMIDFPISLHPNWMGTLMESRPEICLGEMVVPGSHDSGSYSIDTYKLFSAAGRTQNVSILEQLHRGCRFLDLRVAGGVKQSVAVWHGCLQGTDLERVLSDIEIFCSDFPGEFIIIEVVAEMGRDFTAVQKKKTLDVLETSFGDKLFSEPDVEKLLKTPLKELTSSGKQVCVLLHPRMYKDFVIDDVKYTEEHIAGTYGFFSSGQWLQNKWHNTRNISQLLEWNLEEVKGQCNKGKLLNNQIVLTPGVGGIQDIVRLVLGFSSLQPVYMANELYRPEKKHATPVLHTFFQQHSDEKWNLVSLDFVDLCPAILSLLIGMNFANFDILLATVQYGNPNFYRPSMAVTSKVKSHVMREKALFLNVGRDFGSNFGTLTMAYKIHDKYYTIVIHFDGSSTIVLHEFNHIQAGSKEVPDDGVSESGSINPGGGGTVMLWTREEEGDGLEFEIETPF